MRSAKSRGPTSRSKPVPGRSIKSRTLATWNTDRHLRIVDAARSGDGPIRALPEVGILLTPELHRRGVLQYDAHALALRGQTSDYEFRLFERVFHVRVAPKHDRRNRVVGVRGTLKQVDGHKNGNGRERGADPLAGKLATLTRQRHRNSLKSALRSLELAKAVADTARVNAEIRKTRASDAQEKALQAQARAEEEERRSRFLADASAILDTSFDQRETLQSMAELVVLRVADWVTIHFLENNGLKRVVGLHRDKSSQTLLDQVFPEGEKSGFLESGFLESEFKRGSAKFPAELCSPLTPEDAFSFFKTAAGRRRLRNLAVQSLIRTPIKSHGRIIGLLMLGSDDPGRLYDLRDLGMARDLATRISLARESSLLYEEAQREIAMRKEIESRMRVLNTELERRVSDRTRLLEEATREANSFAYTVAHDLRAPLRAITGFCQALKEDYASAVDAVGQDYLDRIVTGARKMDALIRDLLDYARINRAEIKRSFVDLDALMEEVLQQMAAEIRERGAEVQVATPLGRVFAHGPVLAQVLTNLISNAGKFVAQGIRPVVQIRAHRQNHETRILIQDNGIGIAPEHQERIFGIFERLNRAEDYPGTGIGLAIVRRAIERLGGKVGVESIVGAGSTFWVELPSA